MQVISNDPFAALTWQQEGHPACHNCCASDSKSLLLGILFVAGINCGKADGLNKNRK